MANYPANAWWAHGQGLKPPGSGPVLGQVIQGQLPEEMMLFPQGQHWPAMSEIGRTPIKPQLGGIGGQIMPEMQQVSPPRGMAPPRQPRQPGMTTAQYLERLLGADPDAPRAPTSARLEDAFRRGTRLPPNIGMGAGGGMSPSQFIDDARVIEGLGAVDMPSGSGGAFPRSAPRRVQLPAVRDPGFTMRGGPYGPTTQMADKADDAIKLLTYAGKAAPAAAEAAASRFALPAGARAVGALLGAHPVMAAMAIPGLMESTAEAFTPGSSFRAASRPAKDDMYRHLGEGEYARAAGDFVRANLATAGQIAKRVVPIDPALNFISGLVGGQTQAAEAPRQAQALPDPRNFVIQDERIPEAARMDNLGYGGVPVMGDATAEDIQGAYDRLNKQNRLAQVMDSLSGPQQREMLAYGAKQQRPMSWSDKMNSQLAEIIATDVAARLQAEKDPAKRNDIRAAGIDKMMRLSGRGNPQLEMLNELQARRQNEGSGD